MRNHAHVTLLFNRIGMLMLLLPAMSGSWAQTVISGRVINPGHDPVPFASVFIEDTYFGTVCDDSGRFQLPVSLTGTIHLGASSIGMETAITNVTVDKSNVYVTLVLKESFATIDEVTITAGHFATNEMGKAELLKPRDIGTTAGTPGDIQATIEALPGTQRVGHTEGLFVRGGSGRESQYLIDGMIYPNPYYAHVPSIKQHGRLDPFLFSGTVFSAGGYSAQYGQALSSVLILNSKGLADSTLMGGGIHSYGGNLFYTKRWEHASLYTNVSYNDLSLYHRLSNTRTQWNRSPLNRELRTVFRARLFPKGMLKVYATVSDTHTDIDLSQAESNITSNFDITNVNFFVNANYTQHFTNENTSLFVGASASRNADKVTFSGMRMHESDDLYQSRILFRHSITKHIRLLAGGEYMLTSLHGKADTLVSDVTSHLVSLFAESEATLWHMVALRAGMRMENLSYSRQTCFMPRTSLAWKFNRHSQVSFSYGLFCQLPDKIDMLYNPGGLSPEKARHLIFNYQYQQNDRTLRMEVFHKQYTSLVTVYEPQQSLQGKAGYARGLEVFFRDRATVPNLDWWISYSLSDSRRRTILPYVSVTPDYLSKHTLAMVGKYWLPTPGILFSISYLYASPRNYAYLNDAGESITLPVPAFTTLDISCSKPLKIIGMQAILFCSLENVLGSDKTLGYMKLAPFPDPLNIYRSEKRGFFIGLFINMYNDI